MAWKNIVLVDLAALMRRLEAESGIAFDAVRAIRALRAAGFAQETHDLWLADGRRLQQLRPGEYRLIGKLERPGP